MPEEQSTNQNHVKNQIFLWITRQFHFGNTIFMTGAEGVCHSGAANAAWIKSRTKKSGAIAAPEIF